MSTADVEAIAFSLLGLALLAISIAAFRRARGGGPRSQWRYVGVFGFLLCAVLVVMNLRGVTFQGPAHSGSLGSTR